MGVVAIESAISALDLSVFSSRLWLSLLVVPPTCALASISATTRRTREELALFAYGGSGRQILLRYFLRGAVCALIGFSPVVVEVFFVSSSIVQPVLWIAVLLFTGGLFYSLPSMRRIHSSEFVENYKS
jgi:hypothetical protein